MHLFIYSDKPQEHILGLEPQSWLLWQSSGFYRLAGEGFEYKGKCMALWSGRPGPQSKAVLGQGAQVPVT